jgi:NAD(P)-dependent dehydrogenase (short-subunit alcohol dehydrogenase family)
MSVVIVTGGTFGIGSAISLLLAERGHSVVAFGLDAPQPWSVAAGGTKLLRAAAGERNLALDALDADVTDAAHVQRVVDFALRAHGRIDALVNNAGIAPLGTVLDTTEELWDRVLAVNLKGVFLCCKAVLPHLISGGGGSIVNIGSGAGWGKPNMAAYAASKGGIFALSAALAYDHFADRVRVNVVVPGGGGLVTGQSAYRRQAGLSGPPRAHPTAAGRVTTGDDVARAVAFLLSPDAEVVSGTVLDVGAFAHQGGPVPAAKEKS